MNNYNSIKIKGFLPQHPLGCGEGAKNCCEFDKNTKKT